MCGIAGHLLHLSKGTTLQQIQETIESLRHRGPDDESFLLSSEVSNLGINEFSPDQPLCLIHTRLSINDLSEKGRNPLTFGTSGNYVVFNGEIYNFKELRLDLIEIGYEFKTGTDTEVLLAMYIEYGQEFVEKLDGMFAIAIWDFKEQKLKLYRDRLGIKPLYFKITPQGVYFASEIKALLKLLGERGQIDKIGLAQHLQFQNQFEERTLFQGISIALPGSQIIVDATGNVHKARWWKASIKPNHKLTLSEISEKVEFTLREAVKSQLVGDVPIGSYLSGGIDSATISALAREELPSLKTFTIGFETSGTSVAEDNYDERSKAFAAAEYLNLTNFSKQIEPNDYLFNWVETIIAIEDLRVGPSVQILEATTLAREHSTIVLSGAGGDELFAGYPWRYPNSGDEKYLGFEFWYEKASRLFQYEELQEVLKDKSLFELNEWDPHDFLLSVWLGHDCEDSLDKALLMDMEYFLHGLLLVEDKISMKRALEVRVPFLSNSLVELALQIPNKFKVDTNMGKKILRQVAQTILPPSFPNAIKQGFTPPLEGWFRGPLKDVILNFTFKNPKYLGEILELDKLQKVFESHQDKSENKRMLIWSLTSLEIWGRHFILGETEDEIKYDLTNQSLN
jgi:asparagine synthase (glutamine-hydrolysing)